MNKQSPNARFEVLLPVTLIAIAVITLTVCIFASNLALAGLLLPFGFMILGVGILLWVRRYSRNPVLMFLIMAAALVAYLIVADALFKATFTGTGINF